MRKPLALVAATWTSSRDSERCDDDPCASLGESSLSFAAEQESCAVVSGAAEGASASVIGQIIGQLSFDIYQLSLKDLRLPKKMIIDKYQMIIDQ
jgi:hypothetical protein